MKTLLVVYHSMTGGTEQAADVLAADAYAFATPDKPPTSMH